MHVSSSHSHSTSPSIDGNTVPSPSQHPPYSPSLPSWPPAPPATVPPTLNWRDPPAPLAMSPCRSGPSGPSWGWPWRACWPPSALPCSARPPSPCPGGTASRNEWGLSLLSRSSGSMGPLLLVLALLARSHRGLGLIQCTCHLLFDHMERRTFQRQWIVTI